MNSKKSSHKKTKMETIKGKITGYTGHNIIITARYGNTERLIKRKYDTVEIGLPDGRTISPEQRRKAYALIGEIAEWCGELPEYIKKHMKMEFVVGRLEGLSREIFSLANCDMTLAREFITFLVDFVIEHGVPTKVPLKSLCDDVERYVYACLMHKKCAVCGRKAELHHVDVVGMGRNRDTIYQIGMKVLPLCREHYTIAHNSNLIEDEHLIPIPLTREIGKVYGLTRKNLIG